MEEVAKEATAEDATAATEEDDKAATEEAGMEDEAGTTGRGHAKTSLELASASQEASSERLIGTKSPSNLSQSAL